MNHEVYHVTTVFFTVLVQKKHFFFKETLLNLFIHLMTLKLWEAMYSICPIKNRTAKSIMNR